MRCEQCPNHSCRVDLLDYESSSEAVDVAVQMALACNHGLDHDYDDIARCVIECTKLVEHRLLDRSVGLNTDDVIGIVRGYINNDSAPHLLLQRLAEDDNCPF